MLEIQIRFVEESDADKLNYKICSWMQGSPKFRNSEFMVTPVIHKWIKNKLNHIFSVMLDDGRDEVKTIYLEAGSLLLKSFDSVVWAVADDGNYISSNE